MTKSQTMPSKLHVPVSAVNAFINKHYNLKKKNSAFSHVPTAPFKNQVRNFLAQKASQ